VELTSEKVLMKENLKIIIQYPICGGADGSVSPAREALKMRRKGRGGSSNIDTFSAIESMGSDSIDIAILSEIRQK
jgi:hypothetical protein